MEDQEEEIEADFGGVEEVHLAVVVEVSHLLLNLSLLVPLGHMRLMWLCLSSFKWLRDVNGVIAETFLPRWIWRSRW